MYEAMSCFIKQSGQLLLSTTIGDVWRQQRSVGVERINVFDLWHAMLKVLMCMPSHSGHTYQDSYALTPRMTADQLNCHAQLIRVGFQ